MLRSPEAASPHEVPTSMLWPFDVKLEPVLRHASPAGACAKIV